MTATSSRTALGSALDDDSLQRLVDSLGLETKLRLITGTGFWSTAGEPEIGLASMTLSDGATGVRGPVFDERAAAACFPCTTAIAATFDDALMERVGRALASEAIRQDVQAVLAPTLNLHRSPLCGRHFEYPSEDPLVAGRLATAVVRGLQSRGIAACPKHFVGNEAEIDRTTVDNHIDEQTLRELYLTPFEMVVQDAQPWMVMSAYNGVNGAPMSESPLVREVLKDEWAWDGMVVSDWGSIYDTVPSARSAVDLAMHGPEPMWGEPLLDAIRAGDVLESDIDAKVLRILRLAARVGKLEGWVPAPADRSGEEDLSILAREVAAAATVLLANDGILPLAAADLRRVALIGPGALEPRIQGGGSAMVFPSYLVTPEAGLRAALGPEVELVPVMGAALGDALRPLLPEELEDATVRWYDEEGRVLAEEDSQTTWFFRSFRSVHPGSSAMELRCRFVPTSTGEWRVGVAGGPGTFELGVDGRPALEETLGGASQAAEQGEVEVPEASFTMSLEAGRAVDVVMRYRWAAPTIGFAAGFVVRPFLGSEESMIADAVEVARSSDVAVVVVSTSERHEREGGDRTDLALPGRQDDLVRAVVGANPRTIVVVNAGAPVTMPWRDEPAAVLVTWFPGMECGNALADVLLGIAEPGGRLPTTLPMDLENAPVLWTTPVDGVLEYAEQWRIGHNAHLDRGTTPAYWFGHGLGYTTWSYEGLVASSGRARATIRNMGSRPGKQVVMVYASRPEDEPQERRQVLVGYETAQADPGETVTVDVPLDARLLRRWDADAGAWQLQPGPVTLATGPSVGELVVHTTTDLTTLVPM